jgi:hypothetical protein
MNHLESFLLPILLLFTFACGSSESPEAVSESAVHQFTPDFDGNAQIPAAYDGDSQTTVVVLSLDESTVQAMLPPELELAEQTLTRPNRHPVFILHNQFSRLSAPGVPDVAYDELAVYVPAVRLRNGIGCGEAPLAVNLDRTAFMPILHLNHPQPVQLGVDYYGFNKFLSPITADDSSFEVLDPATNLRIYRAEFGAERQLTRSGRRRMQRILDHWPNTLMGKLRSDGTMIWSGFQPDFANAEQRSIDATVELEIPLVGRVTLERSGINDRVLGAWRVRARSIGSIPVACSEAH